jgi:hypothetical protein
MYHIFMRCLRFRVLRLEAAESICKRIERRIEEFKIKESLVEGLLKAAKLFFEDSDSIWPLHYTTFYLGHVSQLDNIVPVDAGTNPVSHTRFLYNVHCDFHLVGIRLTSRIWGMVQRDMARRKEGLLILGMTV